MTFTAALDSLPTGTKSASEKLREVLAMYEEGVAVQRLNLRRRNPHWSDEQLDREIHRWLQREGET